MGGEPFAADRGRAYFRRETVTSGILCVISPALAGRARRRAGQRGEEAQQQHPLPGLVGGGKARQKAHWQPAFVDRRHEQRPLRPPQRRQHKVVEPPLPPAPQCQDGHAQPGDQLADALAGKPRNQGGGQRHDDAQIHAPPQEAHRNRRGAVAANRATKGESPQVLIAKGAFRAARLARIMRLVQSPLAIMAALGLRHGGKVDVDEKE